MARATTKINDPLIPATPRKTMLRETAEAAMATPEATGDTSLRVMDFTDVSGWTFLRLFQVFGNVFANHTNSDKYNAKSIFNRLVYKVPNDPSLGMTGIGWALTGFGLGTIVIGGVRAIYQIYHQQELNSFAYLQKRLNEVARELELPERYTVDNVEADIEHLLETGQITAPYQPADAPSESDSMLTTVLASIRDTRLAKFVSKTWDTLGYQSMVFWIAFMPASLVYGTAVIAMPVILSVTAAVGGAQLFFQGVAGIYRWLTNESSSQEVHRQALIDQIKQRYFIEETHKLKLCAMRNKLGLEPVAHPQPVAGTSLYTLMKGESVIRVQRKPNVAAPAKAASSEPLSAEELAKLEASELGRRVLGTPGQRKLHFYVNLIAEIWCAFITTSFVVWLLGAAASIPFLGAVGAATAAFLNTSVASLVPCCVAGVVLGITNYFDIGAKQRAYERKVYDILMSPMPGHAPMNKMEYYEQCKNRLALAKEQTKVLRDSLQDHPALTQRAGALYDIDKMDVENDYYFEKQKHAPSVGTWFKKGFNRVFALVGGGQSGILMSRLLLLTSGFALGGILAATGGLAFPVFIAVSAVAAVSVGILRLAQYQLDKSHKHKENVVDNLDVRIRGMENDLQVLREEQNVLRSLHPAHGRNTGNILAGMDAEPAPRVAPQKRAANVVDLPREPSDGSFDRKFVPKVQEPESAASVRLSM